MIDKCVVFLRSNPVNPDPRVEKEVNSLIKAGYDVKVVAWDRSEKYKIKESNMELESGRAKVYRLGIPATFGGGIKNNLIPLIIFQLRLIQWLFKYKNQYQIIHACDFDTAYVSYHCARMLNKRFVYDIFDYYVDAFGVPPKLKKLIESEDKKIINNADGVIICTEKRKEQIKGTTPKQLTIIHNSPSSSSFNKDILPLNRDKVKIAYIGILGKGRLLKELANVVINNSKLELHIGGFGNLEDYFQELAVKYSNIIYYGKISYQKALELENSCDIMTAIYDPRIPNHYYAAPNKFYESLMLGKPVIMVKNTGMDHIVLSNNIGEVINYNSESLNDAINQLVNRKSEWSLISHRMKNIYKNEYTWDKMENTLLEFYKDIT